MLVGNELDRFYLVMDDFDRASGPATLAAFAKQAKVVISLWRNPVDRLVPAF